MSRPTVTAVIPHYFDERMASLSAAVGALFDSTVPPTEVIIWNNGPSQWRGPLHAQVRVIDAWTKNIGPKARFLAALTASTDYVFFQDNDMVVERETIANLVDVSAANDYGITTLEGRVADARRPYKNWPKIHGHGLTDPARVPISLGRAELVLRLTLPTILMNFPWSPSTVFDDLYFSWCAQQTGVGITVIPSVRGVSDLRDLRTGVGLCTEPGYYDRRDALARQLFCGGSR